MSNPIRRMQALVKDQRGVTGLETAIILIAFVVVASVFAFTVLSTGIFSAELKGSVIALGVSDKTLSKADAVWLAQTNVTGTATTTDKKEGIGSAQLVVASGFSTGLVAYEDLASTVDLSSVDSIQLWVKSSTTTSSGDLELLLDDTAGCGSTLENVDIPALVADTWKEVTVAISVNDDMTAIKCVGLNRTINESAEQTYRLDDIYGRGQATSIVLTLTNALGGEPLDLFEPSDSDANGISDTDSNNVLIINYTDSNQHVSDIYWSQTFIGENDGDNLLESGEKAEVTVTMSGLASANPIVKDTKFDLELRPQDGGVMVIQRNMPDSVDDVMNLN